jgi:hypothetical protein
LLTVSACCAPSGVSGGVKRYRRPLPWSALSRRVPRRARRPRQDLVREVEITPASPREKALLQLATGGPHMTTRSTPGAPRDRARSPCERLTRGAQRHPSAYPSSTSTRRRRSSPRGVAGLRSHPRASGGLFMHDPASDRRRILLPRNPVNKGMKKGRESSFGPGPSQGGRYVLLLNPHLLTWKVQV